MSSHTPGPWVFSYDRVRPVDGPQNGTNDICHVYQKHQECGRLIAAAPDLLAACQSALAVLPGLEVRSWPPGHELKRQAIESLKAAIEKAGGK